MRLIDADYLKSILNSGGGESVNINISKSMPLGDIVDTVIQAYRKCLFAELEKVPTAYDVDKVVERLETLRQNEIELLCKNESNTRDMQAMRGHNVLQAAIKIVKTGGIE